MCVCVNIHQLVCVHACVRCSCVWAERSRVCQSIYHVFDRYFKCKVPIPGVKHTSLCDRQHKSLQVSVCVCVCVCYTV